MKDSKPNVRRIGRRHSLPEMVAHRAGLSRSRRRPSATQESEPLAMLLQKLMANSAVAGDSGDTTISRSEVNFLMSQLVTLAPEFAEHMALQKMQDAGSIGTAGSSDVSDFLLGEYTQTRSRRRSILPVSRSAAEPTSPRGVPKQPPIPSAASLLPTAGSSGQGKGTIAPHHLSAIERSLRGIGRVVDTPLGRGTVVSAAAGAEAGGEPADYASSGSVSPSAPAPAPPIDGALGALMATFDNWGFDVFAADTLVSAGALSCVGHAAFLSHGLTKFVPQDALAAYLALVTASYRTNPYHNAVHAADVTQSTHWFLRTAGFGKSLTKESHIAVILSAIVHDVAHPGVNNRFLVETWDDIAIQYNDSSVLENFHSAVAFNLMRKEDTAVLTLLNTDQRRHVREMMITMILGTDMSKHMSMCADFEKRIQDGIMDMEDDAQAILALQVVVHAADISNPAKPWPLYKEWTTRIVTEFFAQVRLCGTA